MVFGRRISAEMYRKLPSEAARLEQEELDIRCLQLLRATIHNEERKLPEDWEENAADNKKYYLYLSSICGLFIMHWFRPTWLPDN